MSQSTYSLRPRNQLDYALLNSGKQLQFPVYDISPLKASPDPNEDGLSSNRDAAPAPLTSDPGEEFMELQKLLTQAKEENEALEKTFQLEAMRQELQALRLRNEQLDRRRHATPSINGGAKLLREDPKPAQVLQDLRSKKSLSTRADKFLATLEDSSSEEDSDGKDHIPVSRGRRHTLKSGKDSKITSRVLSPQLWPHSHLSLSYISKEKKYDELSLAEFAAGYAAILQRPTLSPSELRARIDHFAALMYLATQYTWSSVRDLHAAVLFEIECDRAKWGDSFTYLESRILQSLSRSSRSGSGAPRSENPASVFFCRDFQHGTCKHQKDHFGTLRGERKWFQHICARCWVDSRLIARHSEFAKECPLFTDTSKQKTTSSADSQV